MSEYTITPSSRGARRPVRAFLVALTLALPLVPSSLAQVPTGPPDTVGSSFNDARDVKLLDWDGDGDLDVVGAAFSTQKVRVWRNQEFGWLTLTFPTTGPANDLDVGDVDGDGTVDVLFAMGDGAGTNDRVGVVLNRSSAFTVTVNSTGVSHPTCAALADLDGDGDLDAVACEFSSGQISWHENVDGDGETWVYHLAAFGLSGPGDVFPHDLDLDGDLDLLVATFTELVWLENRLNGPSTSWLTHGIDGSVPAASSVVAGDIDGDGEDEIVAGAVNTPLLAWWDRPAVLTQPWSRQELQSTYAVADVTLGDPDQDGDLDILAGRWHASEGDLRLWENDGAGSFTDHDLGGSYEILRAVALGDLDGDGAPDFVLAGGGSDVVDTLENRTVRSTSELAYGGVDPEPGDPSPLAYGLVDLDRDGDLDIVSYDPDERLRFRDDLDDTDGVLLQAISAELAGPKAFELADIDGDGDQDVVMALDQGLEWIENVGFAGPWPRHTIDGASTVEDLLVVDLNRSGDLDVVGFDSALGEVRWWRNTGDGGGWFENFLSSAYSEVFDLQAADLDGVGQPEVLVTSSSGVNAHTRIADTAFSLTPISEVKASNLVVADFDRDGDLDVAGSDSGEGKLFFWENDGDGEGWSATAMDFSSDVTKLVALDVDLDGDQDVVAGSPVISGLALGTGDGFPSSGEVLPFFADLLEVGDLDGDGFPDALVLNSAGHLAEVRNLHGPFGLGVDAVHVEPSEGLESTLFTLELEHLGRVGDQGVEPAELSIVITTGDGTPLTGPQVAALFDRLRLYRVEGAVETLIAEDLGPSTGSPLSLTVLPAGGAEVVDAPSAPGLASVGVFELRATLEPDAGDTLSTFRLELNEQEGEVVVRDESGTGLVSTLPWDGLEQSFDVIDVLFSDGFEDGNTDAWSVTAP